MFITQNNFNNKMKRIAIVFLTVFMWSCENPPPTPLNRKMAAVLKDINIAEAALQGTTGTTRDSLFQLYYRQVFTIHDVTEEDFYKYMDSLRNNPSMAAETYEYIKKQLETETKKDKAQ